MKTSANHSATERRRFHRVQFDGLTSVIVNDHTTKVTLEDLSLKGALISSQQPLQCVDTDTATLHIQLSDQAVKLTFNTSIVWQYQQQYGLRFDAIDIDTMSHLRRLIELNLGDEKLLERELEQLIPETHR